MLLQDFKILGVLWFLFPLPMSKLKISTLEGEEIYTGCYGSPCRNFNHKENLSKESTFYLPFFSENVPL
jgi:hypothetical protein